MFSGNIARYVLSRSELRQPLKTPCSAEGLGLTSEVGLPIHTAVDRESMQAVSDNHIIKQNRFKNEQETE